MFTWLNPPARWSGDARRIELVTAEKTDFWRHLLRLRARQRSRLSAPFQVISRPALVQGDYEALYDQAGLMLRRDERNWIKTGIEFTDGLMHFSVVVTREVSDWSVIPLPDAAPSDACRCG